MCLQSSEESDDLGERAKIQRKYRPVESSKTKAKDLPPNCCDGVESFHSPKKEEEMDSEENETEEHEEHVSTQKRRQGSRLLVGQTPPAIRQQHFRHLSELLCHKSVVEFAREVVGSTAAQRQSWLEILYGEPPAQNSDTLHPSSTSCEINQQAAASTKPATEEGGAAEETCAQEPPPSPPRAPTAGVVHTASESCARDNVLAEDSCSSQTDNTALVSPFRQRQQQLKLAADTSQQFKHPGKTVIPESDSLGLRSGSSSLLTGSGKERVSKTCKRQRPDAEELFSSFLVGTTSAAISRGDATTAKAESKTATNTGVTADGDISSAHQQPAAVDHDLELADMLFG